MGRHRRYDPIHITEDGDEHIQLTRDGHVRICGFDTNDLGDALVPEAQVPDLIRALVEAYRA